MILTLLDVVCASVQPTVFGTTLLLCGIGLPDDMVYEPE
jgi:hypothetical protein